MDSEFIISAWSPEWSDGSGVARAVEWFLSTSDAWRLVQAWDFENYRLATAMDVVRTSGYAKPRAVAVMPVPDCTPVVCELSYMRRTRSGPLDRRIIEYAASTIPCAVGLHAVDIRRPVSEDVFQNDRRKSHGGIVRDVLSEFRTFYGALPLSWALCSTFGRGPSVAELYRKKSSSAQIGAIYLSKSVLATDPSSSFAPAHVVDVGSGWEIVFAELLGGTMKTLTTAVHTTIWATLRTAVLSQLPWDTLNELGSD
jgi:hypothetical protein